MDVLLLLAEESKYAKLLREDIVRHEFKREAVQIESRRKRYSRPKSRSSTMTSRTPMISVRSSRESRSRRRSSPSSAFIDDDIEEGSTFSNSPINTSRRVTEKEALYMNDPGIKFTLKDLQLAEKGKKKISVRELRPIANKWGIDSTLKKTDLLRRIISAYEKRLGVDDREREQNHRELHS